MLKDICFLLCFCTFSLTAKTAVGPPHEFHLSKCQIEYNPSEKALQMTLHLFIDDLEDALRQKGADKMHLCSEKESADANQQLYKYLQENFILQVNQQKAEYDFIGKEQSEDLLGVWVYLEITDVTHIEEIDITNRILLEAFADQKNITSISVPPGKQSYFILQRGQEQKSVKY